MTYGRTRIAQVCGGITILVAALVLVGWVLDISTLKSITPGYITMKANTAIAFIMISVANLVLADSRQRPTRSFLGLALATVVIALMAATLFEYLSGHNLGIDELIFRDLGTMKPGTAPGRLAPITAVNFILVSIGIFLSSRRNDRWAGASQGFTLVAFLISFQAFVGYLCGVTYSFGAAYYTQMAVHTTVLFTLVCVQFLLNQGDRGFLKIFAAPTSGGFMARRLIGMALIAPPLCTWLALVGQRAGLYDADFSVLIRVLANVIFFLILVWKNAVALHATDEERTQLLTKQENARVMERNEARLRTIFNTAFDAIVGMDAQGLITDWNPRAEAVFGWKRSEAIGKSMIELICPTALHLVYRQQIARLESEPEDTSKSLSIETEAQRMNGEPFPVQLSMSALRLDGKHTFTAFIADITERKKNEQELIQAKQTALDAARSKSEFLANMSHEIRTPLNGIIGMTDLLLDTELDDVQTKYSRIVQSSGNALLTIINDILDFSKIEAGKLSLEVIDFNLVSIVESQTDLLAARAREKNLSVMAYVDPAVPATLRGDPGRIGQVILNLLGNAIKFTKQGEIVINVGVERTVGSRIRLRFEVKDQGIGLSRDTQERLFQPFTQADGSTARKYGGTGLGLSICRRLVEMMSGEIGVVSALNEGSTFWFTTDLELSDKPALTVIPARELPDIRVLIVDDSETACLIISKYLESWKIASVAARSGEEALKALRRAALVHTPFDIAIVDKCMPEMDGISLAEAIRNDEATAGTKLICMTAFDRPTEDASLKAAGFAGYLTKPVKQSDLFDAISTTMHPEGSAPARKPIEPSVSRIAAPTAGNKAFRLLVAEDNSVNQLLALSLLRKMGYTAQAVANGKEVLHALRNASFDLILMDCQMPELDGYQTTRAIRRAEASTGRHVPIIALTANAMKEDKDRCLECGMDDYVSKPIKRDQLEAALVRWLGAHKDRIAS